jgi:anti-sigma regulatory factor (Ser/Thr protein kinase)/GNAT superfamily N-acetyltransferase
LSMHEEGQVARLNIAAKLEYLPAVLTLLRDVSQRLGLSSQDIGRLELITEEACVNVIDHAFDPGESGFLEVIILQRPGQVVVAVEDQGMPFDYRKLEQGEQSGLGIALMKAFADEINFLNLGRRGKRVEMVKNLPRKELAEYASGPAAAGPAAAAAMPADTPVTVRLMTPDETTALARCIYRCYGYTYMENVYYPDQVRELLESGLMTSFTAVLDDGEIVGHTAITRERPDSKVGDYGKAVVDPRYRTLRLGTRLTELAIEYARKAGMLGLYSEAATVHTYSEKALSAAGWCETGALLGFVPETFYFRQIQHDQSSNRTSVVIYYGAINPAPERDIYPPLHHLSVIRKIYDRLKLKRNLVTGAGSNAAQALPPGARVDIRTYTGERWAYLSVVEFGSDLVELVEFRLKELRLRHIDCIYIDLPLSHPATQQYCASLEMLGFFYGAVIPEFADGDVLRLQYLNNVEINAGEIQTATKACREMVDYVLRSQK